MTRFVDDGLVGVRRLTSARLGANAHRAAKAGRPSAPLGRAVPLETPRGFAFTIHDVALDGWFPGAGYEQRVADWAQAVRAAYDGRPNGAPSREGR